MISSNNLDNLNRVKKQRSGVYTLDDEVNFDHDKPLVVAVHPFFLDRDCFSADYYRGVDQFMDTYPGPILILEEEGELAKAVTGVSGAANVSGRYIVLTHVSNPRPLDINYDELFNLINGFKGSVKLMGGYLDDNISAMFRGCLGYFARHLESAEIPYEMMPELTFSRDDIK